MSTRSPRFVRLFLMLFLFASAGWTRDIPAPKLPSGVTPLPEKNARHLENLLHTAEKYRGLKALKPMPAGSLSVRSLKRQMAESLPRDSSPQELKALEVSLKAFGLIPEAMDLRLYLPELMSSQVAGFYDPEKKYLALVDLPKGGSGKNEEAVDEDMILVHELTHALQDQHFDLRRFEGHDPMSDAGTARTALVEGDATLIMLDFKIQMSIEVMPGMDTALGASLQDTEKLMGATPDLPGMKEMAAAPVWIRDTLLFSYLQGAAFSVSVKRQGGQALLDYAFTTDPPRSTEQILHPEKWHTRRDDPIVLRFPDLAAELPGYRKVAEGEMGELSQRIFLRQGLKSREQADAAAAGWGGDRFAVYEKAGGRLVIWLTEWDGEADAGEFRTALQSLDGWQAEAAGRSRVLAMRGILPEERWAGVRARLTAAAAERPANKEIDLKAIGAVPVKMDAAAFQEMMTNPLFQEQVKESLKEPPPGEISADGRVYTNPGLGFSIRLPESFTGWALDREPASPFLVGFFRPEEGVRIAVGHQEFPAGFPTESVTEMVEMGIKSALPEFRPLEEKESQRDGFKVRDVLFSAAAGDGQVFGTLRFMARGSDLFMFIAAAPADSWKRYQESTLQILNTFQLLEPQAGTP